MSNKSSEEFDALNGGERGEEWREIRCKVKEEVRSASLEFHKALRGSSKREIVRECAEN